MSKMRIVVLELVGEDIDKWLNLFVVLRRVKTSIGVFDHWIDDSVELKQEMSEFLEQYLHKQLEGTIVVNFFREKITLIALSYHEVNDLLSYDFAWIIGRLKYLPRRSDIEVIRWDYLRNCR